MTTRKVALRVVTAPAIGVVLGGSARAIGEHSVDYTCGRCGTVLLHADAGQVHGQNADRIIRRKTSGLSWRPLFISFNFKPSVHIVRLALSGHLDQVAECPLSGVKRTFLLICSEFSLR